MNWFCSANQLTGFYVLATLAFNELKFAAEFGDDAFLKVNSTRDLEQTNLKQFKVIWRKIRPAVTRYIWVE